MINDYDPVGKVTTSQTLNWAQGLWKGDEQPTNTPSGAQHPVHLIYTTPFVQIWGLQKKNGA